MLLEVALQSRVIVSSIPKQKLQVMGKRVEQFDHRLVVVAAGRGEQEAQDEATEADHALQFAAEVLHGLAVTDTIVGSAAKITALFAAFVAHTRHGSRVNHGRLFQQQSLLHELQAHPYGQDHRPEVSLAAVVAATFIESGKERQQTRSVQPKEVILSRFADQFLIEGDGDHLAIRKMWGWPRSLQGVLNHG